jgi:hypothetical protein
VSSRPGEGTKISVTVPAPMRQVEAETIAKGEEARVLLGMGN